MIQAVYEAIGGVIFGIWIAEGWIIFKNHFKNKKGK